MKYVAIDIGSSFIKAAVLDTDKFEIIGHNTVQMPQPFSSSGKCFEVDAELIFVAVKKILEGYVTKLGSDLSGILFSTQMHGFVLADQTGYPLTNYISWQDERCLEEMPAGGKTYLQYLETIISREDMAATGVYLKAPLALCNLFTLLEQGFVPPAQARFCTLGSYIILRLTGSNVCHLTNAAPTGFADIVNGKWNEKLINTIGCEKLIFPELKNSLDICAYYRQQDLVIPVYPDIGDQQACVLGCMARPQQDVNINIGTAAQLAIIKREFGAEYGEVRPFFDDYYLHTISRMPGGRNLDVLIEFIQDIGEKIFNVVQEKNAIWDKIICRTDAAATQGLQVNTSFFKTMESDSGAITNINNTNLSLETLFSAAFADFAVTYDKYIDRFCSDRGTIERIVFSGGVACKNPVLMKVITEITGLKGILPPMADEVFVGLFRIALVCSKACANIAETYEVLMVNRESNSICLQVL